jgi:hypothetical protein
MFQKRMQRAAMVLLVAALLLTAPLQAAGWTSREAPGLLGTAWSWLVEWLAGAPVHPALRSGTAADTVPTPPQQPPGGEVPPGSSTDDGGAIDPNG